MSDKPKQVWQELDVDAYRKLVEECKDDKEFRKRLKELAKAPPVPKPVLAQGD